MSQTKTHPSGPAFMVGLFNPGTEVAFGAIIAAERPRTGHTIDYAGRQYIVLGTQLVDSVGARTLTPPGVNRFHNLTRPEGAFWCLSTVYPDFSHESWAKTPIKIYEAE